MEGYITKLMELETEFEGAQSAHAALQKDLNATQDKVASLHSEVKEKTACNDILRQQYNSTKEVSHTGHLNAIENPCMFSLPEILFADKLLFCVCMCDISIDIDYVY